MVNCVSLLLDFERMLSVQVGLGMLGYGREVNWRTNVIRGLMTNRLDSVRAFKWLDGAADNGAEH